MMNMSGSIPVVATTTAAVGGGGVQQPQSIPTPATTTTTVANHRTRPEDSATHITVSDPVQHADGLNKYTSYRVDVRPPSATPGDVNLNAANYGTYSAVLRRYSDFLWLYEHLHVERAGAIVPPVPEKQPVGRFSPQFVEERRRHLERFLRRVSVHPELADAQCLDTFLRADDVTFQAAKNAKGNVVLSQQQANSYMQAPMSAAGSAGGSKKDGIKRWFSEAKTSMTGDLVRSPDDDLFDEIHRYVTGLDNQMRNVTHHASGLVRKGKEIANGLFEFGLAFNLLGQSETDALGDALGKMGETADRLSVLSAEHAELESSNFEEPLQDYIKTIGAVKLALQRRHEKRLTYSARLSEVESKQNALGKLRGQMGSESKAYAAEMSFRRAKEAANAAGEDFAAVSQRVLREVDRFKREKAEDMRRTVLDYINLQVEHNKKMEAIWAELIPQLERVQLDNDSNVVGGGGQQPPPPQQQQQQQFLGQQQQQYGVGGGPPQQGIMQQQQPMGGGGYGVAPAPSMAPPPPVQGAAAAGIDPNNNSTISVQYRGGPQGGF